MEDVRQAALSFVGGPTPVLNRNVLALEMPAVLTKSLPEGFRDTQ
jgi:hypothetical protein